MKIVFAHKFFYRVGGTEQYLEDLAGILTEHGHQTIPFSLKNEKNPPTPYEGYFLESLDYRARSPLYKARNAARILSRTLYSWEARRKLDALLRDERPDLAHLQLIDHHISPSILHTLRARRVPVVQSVSNYKHVCASYRLYLFDRQQTCRLCLYGKHYNAVRTRCLKGSLAASALASFEMYLHAAMRIYHLVDRFIVPNRFVEELLLGAGYPARKIARLLNPLRLDQYAPGGQVGRHLLYFGRVDPEKGVSTLVRAMQRHPRLPLVIVGDGQAMDAVRAEVASLGLCNVEFAGPQWGNDLLPYLDQARAVIVPSQWYELSPMVIYQAYAMAKPVIAADLGGIPDLLTPETGRLFAPGDVDGLAARIDELAYDDARLQQMGRAARAWAQANLDPRRYYERLMDVYAQAQEESQR